MNKFLQWCAGANPEILAQEECATDRMRYEGLGKMILFTGLLASLSGGYALFTVFQSVPIAMSLGATWGSLIVTLDRSIVMNIKKKRRGGAVRQLFTVFPRLGLAAVLAVVIAKPIELKLFEREITAAIVDRNERELAARKEELAQGSDLERLVKQKATLQGELNKLTGERDRWRDATLAEAEGIAGSRVVGKGIVYQEKLQEVERYERLITEKQREIDNVDDQIRKVEQDHASSIQTLTTAKENADSILLRITTLEQLGEEDQVVRAVTIFVSLLFVLLETSPVIAKLLSPYGPYDAIVEAREAAVVEGSSFMRESRETAMKEDFTRARQFEVKRQEMEFQQKVEQYNQLRTRFQQFINEQFTALMSISLQHQDYAKAQERILQTIIAKAEEELSLYALGVSASAQEIAFLFDNLKADAREALFKEHLYREAVHEQLKRETRHFNEEAKEVLNQVNGHHN